MRSLWHLTMATTAIAYSPEPMASDSNGNGVSNTAPALSYYASFCGSFLGGEDTDPHAVHGIELAAGGFAVAGKYDIGKGAAGGFVVAVEERPGGFEDGKHLEIEDGAAAWQVKFGVKKGNNGRSGVNMVAERGGYLFAVGFEASSSSRSDAVLMKIETSTGNVVWTYRYSSSKTSAFEAVQISDDGGGLVLSGLVDAKDYKCLEGFKSYGNPGCGTAVVMKFEGSALEENSAPSSPTWVMKFSGYVSAKNLRVTGKDGGYVVATFTEDEVAAVIRTNSNGVATWKKSYGSFGEITDVEYLAQDGVAMLTGHGGNQDELYGRLARVNLDDGTTEWEKSYGKVTGGKKKYAGITDGNPNNWVYHECWSLAVAANGEDVVLSCGVGIEGCSNKTCKNDPRNNWRSLLLSVDAKKGDVNWHRMDNFGDINNGKTVASASEFVVVTADGGYLATNDEECGVGIMRLEGGASPPIGSPTTDSPVATPTKRPVATPTKPPVAPPTGDDCIDDAGFSIKIGKKIKKCAKLKKNQCKKWDKRKGKKRGKLVFNYCQKLCGTCTDPNRCKDDQKVKFIDENDNKFKCSAKGIEESCNEIDKKKRRVSEYCRETCNFCKD